jgi:hypothetical protein
VLGLNRGFGAGVLGELRRGAREVIADLDELWELELKAGELGDNKK